MQTDYIQNRFTLQMQGYDFLNLGALNISILKKKLYLMYSLQTDIQYW